MEKPIYQTISNLSSKGQVVISAKARKLYALSDVTQFDQDVFSDGTIILRPRHKTSQRENFVREAEAYYATYGAVNDEKGFLDSKEIGEEIID